MILYPAMDLLGGSVVRLAQGRFDAVTRYPLDPAAALQAFHAAGAEWAHVVDLDGARAGAPVQHDLIARLAASGPMKLQVAGGIRRRDEIVHLLDAGARRVVVGSQSVREPDLVAGWIEEFGADRLTLSLDVRIVGEDPMVAVSGWSETSAATLWEIAARFPEARHLLVTDIGRDGMLAGPNFALLEEVSRRLPGLRLQASGGIASLDDLGRLRTDGAIVGKALWEGRIDLREAVRLARG